MESTAHTSESSEEFLEEPEQSVIDFEDESSDKDVRPAPEAQPQLEKQDGEKVWESPLNTMNGVNFNFLHHVLLEKCNDILF